MLHARNLHKSFHNGGKNIQVLRDISIDIEEGEFLSIVGRSGSGKTTLLNVLSTLVKPDEGSLYYQKNDLASATTDYLNTLRRHDFAVVFQFHHLLPYLSVLQNTLLPFMRSFAPVPREILSRAEQCLDRLGLVDKKDRLPGELSGGEQQRVAIARALVKSAKILFADEPTGSLDQKTGEEIMQLLEELHQDGLTIAMVTHEPLYARRAGRILEMAGGEIVL